MGKPRTCRTLFFALFFRSRTACIAVLLLFCKTLLFAQPSETFDLYVSLAKDGDSECSFGNVEGCRLFRVRVNLHRDAAGLVTQVEIDKNAFTEVLPDAPAVMADVSPDGEMLAFMSTSDNAGLRFRGVYVLDLDSGALLDVTQGQNHNELGQWPHWISNTQLMYANFNYCPNGNADPGCSQQSRYQDVLVTSLSAARDNVLRTEFLIGDVSSGGVDSRPCAGEDPVLDPSNPGLIAFHSTTIDGKSVTQGSDCPWVEGFPGMPGQPYAVPKPVVFNMSAAPAGNLARNFVAGVDYWLFDLAEAGINSIAHLYVAPDGVILGTEQNTVEKPFRQCSLGGVSVENGPNQCLNAGGKIILYNRIFGFEKDGDSYRNVRRNEDSTLPLFRHLHPTELPDSDRYYDPQNVGDNFQYKYAEFCGSSKTLLATVMAHDRQSTEISFSRLMLIDIADPDNPVYFDLTGWLEDEFSDRWAPGTATGFTGTAFVPDSIATSVSDLSGGDLPLEFSLRQNYPNPFNPETTIRYQLPETAFISLTILDSNGRTVRTLVRGISPAGDFSVNWDGLNESGREVSSGTYFYRLRAGAFEQVRAMTLVR